MPYRTINVGVAATPVLEVLGSQAPDSTFVNNDLVNTIWLGAKRTVLPGDSDSIAVPALGSAPLDTNHSTYAVAAVNNVQAYLVPGTGGWTASPSKIQASLNALGLAKDTSVNAPSFGPATLAQQVTQQTAIPNNIAATGVPLLALPQGLSSSSFTVNSGVSTTIGPFTFNQPGYEILFGVWSSTIVVNAIMRVLVQWIDPTSGAVVDQQIWWAIPGSDATTNLHNISGTGPTENTQVQFTFTAFNANINVVNCIVHANSRLYQRHNFYSIKVANLALNGGPIAVTPHDVSGFILANATVGGVLTGAHTTQYLPLYCGKIQLWVHTSSNTSDATVTLNAFSDQTAGLVSPTNFLQTKTDGNGNVNLQCFLPRAQMQVLVSNGNAATQSLTLSMIMTDY